MAAEAGFLVIAKLAVSGADKCERRPGYQGEYGLFGRVRAWLGLVPVEGPFGRAVLVPARSCSERPPLQLYYMPVTDILW